MKRLITTKIVENLLLLSKGGDVGGCGGFGDGDDVDDVGDVANVVDAVDRGEGDDGGEGCDCGGSLQSFLVLKTR